MVGVFSSVPILIQALSKTGESWPQFIIVPIRQRELKGVLLLLLIHASCQNMWIYIIGTGMVDNPYDTSKLVNMYVI